MVNYSSLDDMKVGQLVNHNAGAAGSIEQLRQNVYVLHDRNIGQYFHDGTGSDWTTTSAQLTKIDAGAFQLTVTSNGGPIMTWFHGSTRRATGSAHYVFMTIMREGDPVDAYEPNFPQWATTWKPISCWKPYWNLPAGEHTFAVYWMISGGSVAAELQAASKPCFTVWEGY